MWVSSHRYFITHQPMHPLKDTSCDIQISPGSHECGESGGAIGRVQAFSFVAFKVQVYVFCSRTGGQPILTPSSSNRSLGAFSSRLDIAANGHISMYRLKDRKHERTLLPLGACTRGPVPQAPSSMECAARRLLWSQLTSCLAKGGHAETNRQYTTVSLSFSYFSFFQFFDVLSRIPSNKNGQGGPLVGARAALAKDSHYWAWREEPHESLSRVSARQGSASAAH